MQQQINKQINILFNLQHHNQHFTKNTLKTTAKTPQHPMAQYQLTINKHPTVVAKHQEKSH